MTDIIQNLIDQATTKKQSYYHDPSTMQPKPIYTADGQPKMYDDFDKEKFAALIIQECVNFLKDVLDDHFAAEQLTEHWDYDRGS